MQGQFTLFKTLSRSRDPLVSDRFVHSLSIAPLQGQLVSVTYRIGVDPECIMRDVLFCSDGAAQLENPAEGQEIMPYGFDH